MTESRILCEVVLVNQAGQVLILRRSDTDIRRPGQWDVPGGHTDPGESLETAAVRELEEEAGIRISPDKLKLAYSTAAIRDGINLVWLFFVAKTDASPEDVRLSHEHSEYCWAPLDEAVEAIEYELQKTALRHILDNDLLSRA